MISNTMASKFYPINSAASFANVSYWFDRSLTAGHIHKLIAMITRRSYRLLDLNSYPSEKKYGHYAGQREVPLDNIRGTEGRLNDFDDSFHPLNDRTRQRWMTVAQANEQGLDLPPVELIQVGNIYFVRDGHHRISVARAFGQTTIMARVTVW